MNTKIIFILLYLFITRITADVFLTKNTSTEFTLPRYSIKTVRSDSKQYNTIVVNKSRKLVRKGLPELPFYTYNVASSGLIKTPNISDAEVTYMKVDKILPSKGHFNRNINPATILPTESSFYERDEWYPAQNILVKNYSIGKVKGAVVQFFPFQYNPKIGLLKIIKKCVIDGVGKTTITTSSSLSSEIFASRFKNASVTNSRYTKVTDGNFMAIITPMKYKPYAEKLADWKNVKGIATTVYIYPDDFSSSSETGIKNKLQLLYDSDSLTYVLLLGDIDDIPSLKHTDLWDSQSGVCDADYVLLSGNDFYPDAFIGRLSVKDSADARNQVDKILNYEKYPDSLDWYSKAVGIASNEKATDLYDYEWMNQFRDTLTSYTYTNVDTFYDPTAKTSDLSNAVNNGRSLINYMGHGNEYGWGTTSFYTSNASILTNGSKLPVIISVACLVGKFDFTSQCFAEEWQTNPNGGSVGFFGATFSQPWEPPQYAAREMLTILKSEAMTSIGAILFNGEMEMLDGTVSTSVSDASNSTLLTWTLFGDPSMTLYTRTPETVEVQVPFIDSGSQSVNLSLSKAIKGHYCFYHKDKGILSSGTIDAKSNATAQLTTAYMDTMTLTVTGINIRPIQKTIISGVASPIKASLFKADKCIKFIINDTKLRIVSNDTKEYTVKIFDMSGRMILKQRSNSSSGSCIIDNNFNSGILLVKIEGREINLNKKITILK